jgi:hypothetical protein
VVSHYDNQRRLSDELFEDIALIEKIFCDLPGS